MIKSFAIVLAAISVTSVTGACQLRVSSYPQASTTDSDAGTILSDGSHRVFNASTGSTCGLDLSLARPILRIQSDSMPIVDQESYDSVCAGESDIHVVPSIKWCGGHIDGLAYGCSKTCETVIWTGLSSPVKDATESLWMHEFGHTRNLKHPYQDSDSLLMNSNLNPGQFNVDSVECNLLLALGHSIGPSSSEQPNSVPKVSVEQFVSLIYIHGFPIDIARRYTRAEIDRVTPWLNDMQKQVAWPNIVMLMGVTGDPDYTQQLIRFVERLPLRDAMAHQARVSVPVALGELVRWGGEKRGKSALKYLAKHTTPSSWPPTLRLDAISRELSEFSIIALGETGSPAAMELLEELLRRPDPFIRQPAIQKLIRDAISFNANFR